MSNKSIDLSLKSAQECLLKWQTENGLWPYLAGKEGALEPACWAALACRSNKESLRLFLKKVLEIQNSDGGWSNDQAQLGSDWTTAVVLMTLRILRECSANESLHMEIPDQQLSDTMKKAINWLIENRTQKYSPGARFALLLWKGPEYDYKRGWPWTPDTFDWVEPTAYTLVALRKLDLEEKLQRIVAFAESFLLNVSCPTGGWNCGDRNPLGTVIPADVQFSTLALMALRSKEKEVAIKRSVDFLKNKKMESTAEYAWGALALKTYKEDNSNLLQEVIKLQDSAGKFTDNIITHSIACLAMEKSNLVDYF